MKNKINWIAVFTCSLVMICEGFDLVVYGATIPLLINDATISMDTASAGSIGSLVFLGMLLGGIAAGKINQVFTSRTIILVGTAAFSVAALTTGLVAGIWTMGLLRFITGLGLGIVLPTALSLARNTSEERRAPLVVSITMAGIPAGGTLAAITVALMGASANWRTAFIIAGIIGLMAMIVSIKGLKGAEASTENESIENQKSLKELFRGSKKRILLFLALSTFAFLFSFYGITTWLTQLMQEFNLPMENSLQLTAALNIGAICGSLITSFIAVKYGARIVGLTCGILAAFCLVGIAMHPESSILLGFLIVVTGATSISAQNLLNTLVSNAFPSYLRGGALGFTLGFGRLGAVCAPAVGGYVLTFGLGPEAVLCCFAGASIIGCIALSYALTSISEKTAVSLKNNTVMNESTND